MFCNKVSQPPTITQQSPKDYIVDPRENIVIQCEAKGKPPPRLVLLLLFLLLQKNVEKLE